jgi:murein DD-endopeptidase MepM/ murein hydrolase activator NlpD
VASYRPIMRDYKPATVRRQPRSRWLLWFVAGLGLPLVTVALLSPDNNEVPRLAPAASIVSVDAVPASTAVSNDIAEPEVRPAYSTEIPPLVAAPEPEYANTVLTVRPGDSLDRLFRRNNLSVADLTIILRDELARDHLRVVKPGDQIVVRHHEGNIKQLRREIDAFRSLQVDSTGEGFTVGMLEHKITKKRRIAEGRIKSSLYMAGADAGVSDRVIMNLAGIFAWDIDFILDIRTGDEFRVIVEELYRDGKRIAEGEILAAEFTNQGEVFRAIRYETSAGQASYFTPDGRNMRKAFLRAPLSFSRISSNFNPNRRHPVLNTIRAHKGVDYAAPHGTPIKAAGDGKIIFRGVKGGYGNTVILQHGGNITTLYAHMSNFDKKARNGTRVKQGQVIGYVGQTGLASGPHLHYEYRKNGAHLNPRTVKLPNASPIDASLKADFLRAAAPLIDQLNYSPLVLVSAADAGNNESTLFAGNPDAQGK